MRAPAAAAFVLVVGSLLLMASVVVEATRSGLPAPAPLPAVAPEPRVRPVEAPHAARHADTILQRPLFSPTRRPATAAAAPVILAARPIPPLLAGTVVAGRQERFALVLLPSAQRPVIVREGDTVGRFRVVRIGAGEIVADGPDGQIALRIRSSQAAPEPPAGNTPIRQRPGPNDQDE